MPRYLISENAGIYSPSLCEVNEESSSEEETFMVDEHEEYSCPQNNHHCVFILTQSKILNERGNVIMENGMEDVFRSGGYWHCDDCGRNITSPEEIFDLEMASDNEWGACKVEDVLDFMAEKYDSWKVVRNSLTCQEILSIGQDVSKECDRKDGGRTLDNLIDIIKSRPKFRHLSQE